MSHRLSAFCLSTVAVLFALAGCGKNDAKPSAKGLETDEQKVSYAIGYNMGSGLAKQPALTVDQAALRAGIEDGLSGAKLRLPEDQLTAAFGAIDAKMAKLNEEKARTNLVAANEFLEKNKKRAGVKTTASGIQYEVLKAGKGGRKPKPTDRVEVHYHGTLVDGTVFDSSVERGQPAVFSVNGVIPGWTEVLQLMSAGDKWKVCIHPSLAYGPRPNGKIPPNSALIFEVELLGIK